MSGLRLLPLGVGDAFSTLYYSTCLALEADDSWLLIDCPHPIRKIMREAGLSAGVPLDIDRLLAVALTHLHADHSSGLEGFGFFSRFKLGRQAHILAHPDVSARLWDNHLSAGMEQTKVEPSSTPSLRRLEDFFRITPLSETRPVQVGPFSILCRRTIHSIPTTAFKIWAAGRCLGYSADTAFDPTLIDWLAEADLVVHETGPGILHTGSEKLTLLPPDIQKKIRLIHYPDTFDLDNSSLEALRQGCSYAV